MISQMGKMFITSILKGAKIQITWDCCFWWHNKSRVNIEASSSPFQVDERSKYLYLGGNSSQDIWFLIH